MPGKRPSFQWYPGDWLRDPAVRSVSFAARGLWQDMLCLMFESDRTGYLSVNGSPPSLEQLARMTGGSTEEVTHLLTELEKSGVFSRTAHGMIFSRRMARDEDLREKNANRVAKHRAKGRAPPECNAHVMREVQPCTEEEDEEEEVTPKPRKLGGFQGGLGKSADSAPDFALTAEGLAQAWCFFLTRKRLGSPRDSPLDMAGEFAELIRLGQEPASLLNAILEPTRDRGEHFWQFKVRLMRNTEEQNGKSDGFRRNTRVATSAAKLRTIEAKTIRAGAPAAETGAESNRTAKG